MIRFLFVFVGLLTFSIAACSTTQKTTDSEPVPEKKEMTTRERALYHLRMANGSLFEKDPTGALIHLQTAENLDPKMAEIHQSKALAYLARKDLPAAEQSVRKALSLKKKYPEAANTLGKILIDRKRYDEAATWLERAANDDLYRGAYKAQTLLGIMYYRQKAFDQAGRKLDLAIDHAPNEACVARYYRGNIKFKEGEVATAIGDYKESIKGICANFVRAHFALGLAYERNKNFTLAKKKFLEIQDQFPESPLSERAIKRLRAIP